MVLYGIMALYGITVMPIKMSRMTLLKNSVNAITVVV